MRTYGLVRTKILKNHNGNTAWDFRFYLDILIGLHQVLKSALEKHSYATADTYFQYNDLYYAILSIIILAKRHKSFLVDK